MSDEYHNPKNVESPGEGWRFCLKSEIENPPIDAQIWTEEGWRGSIHKGAPLSYFITYRTQAPFPQKYQEAQINYHDPAYLRDLYNHFHGGEKIEVAETEVVFGGEKEIWKDWTRKHFPPPGTKIRLKERSQSEIDEEAYLAWRSGWMQSNETGFGPQERDIWKAAIAWERSRK